MTDTAASKEKPYAYELEVKKSDGTIANANPLIEKVVYVAKTEKAAIRKALRRPNALEAKVIDTYTERQYRNCFGYPRRGGKEWG